MYYIEQNNKILAYNEILADLQAAIEFKPELAELEIKETDRPIIDFEFADTEEWEAEQLRLAKEAKIKENDIIRDTALNAGVTYKGVLFDSDTDQKINLLSTVEDMENEDVIVWFGMNNQRLECTKQDLLNIGGLIKQLTSFCWAKNTEIKSKIAKAKTIKALNKIIIDYNNELNT